jgi:hypothetical protein
MSDAGLLLSNSTTTCCLLLVCLLPVACCLLPVACCLLPAVVQNDSPRLTMFALFLPPHRTASTRKWSVSASPSGVGIPSPWSKMAACALLLHFCHTVATLHCCYTVATLLLHCCYTVATLLLHCCYTVATLLLHCCYTVVTLLLYRCRTVGTLLVQVRHLQLPRPCASPAEDGLDRAHVDTRTRLSFRGQLHATLPGI